MPLSLRIPSEKEELIRKAAAKSGKSKTSFIIEAVDEKLGLHKSREQVIRDLAGWLSHDEAEELRQAVKIFDRVNKGDWD
jgi:predicted DNA-binding protein